MIDFDNDLLNPSESHGWLYYCRLKFLQIALLVHRNHDSISHLN